MTCSHLSVLLPTLLLTAGLTGTTPLAQAPPPQRPGGGPNQPTRALVSQFDADKDGRLNTEERQAARAFLATTPASGRGGPGGGRMGGRGGRGGPGGAPAGPAPAGPTITPAEVTPSSAPLYDDRTLRTLFLTFETSDWEAELTAFYNTDVEVPATLIVDGRTYPNVGVHYRGASSFFMVPAGYKKSLNLTMDLVDEAQTLHGYRTLNLNNANGDPSLLRAVVYEHIASQYIPTPAANLARVVINGEYWGVYTNVAQFNKDFLRDHFKTDEGVRWKVPGSPQGRGGLEYLGEDVEAYKGLYEIKNKDNAASWRALINLTKVLNTTPAERLEAALSPILNIDGALKFLALENALVNSDGYWTRASDYNIYLDPAGRFHIIPHDINEAMRAGGPGGRGTTLDPLVAAGDPSKPLLSKLLAVPALRAKYLGHVRDIATRWLDWQTLGPIVEQYTALIRADVVIDTKKVITNDAFEASMAGLKAFADSRRTHLLAQPTGAPSR